MSTNTVANEGGLRYLRAQLGLSQEAVARRADVSLATVRNVEHGYRPRQSEAIPRIASALDVSVEELFS